MSCASVTVPAATGVAGFTAPPPRARAGSVDPVPLRWGLTSRGGGCDDPEVWCCSGGGATGPLRATSMAWGDAGFDWVGDTPGPTRGTVVEGWVDMDESEA